MIYFDAAYIAKCYLNEPGAEHVRRLAAREGGKASCEFARLEMFSVVRRHVREGRITAAEAAAVLADFEEDERDGVWQWLPITPAILHDACRRTNSLPRSQFVRAADALHLACAAANGFREVFTNDRHMQACAPHFRIHAKEIVGPG